MHVIQIFSDANLFAGMASDLNITPPPDPNIYGMGAIPKRGPNINVLPPPGPPLSLLQGNLNALGSLGNLGALGSLGSPSTPFACQSQDTSKQLFSAPVTKKFELDSPLVTIEKAANYVKFISLPVSDNEGNTLQLFLNKKLSRQAYKSNIMGPDTFWSHSQKHSRISSHGTAKSCQRLTKAINSLYPRQQRIL